jgi:hypothetical protein
MTESDWQVIAEEAAAVAMRAGMLPGGMGRALQQTGRGEQQSVCQGRSLNVKRLKAFWRTRGAPQHHVPARERSTHVLWRTAIGREGAGVNRVPNGHLHVISRPFLRPHVPYRNVATSRQL